MERNDEMRPSVIDPSQWEWVGPWYQGENVDIMRAYAWNREFHNAIDLIEEKPFDGNHKEKNTCDHCGAFFYYGDVFRHKATGVGCVVGHICLSNTMHMPDRAALDHKRMVDRAAAIRDRLRHTAQAENFLNAHFCLREILDMQDRKGILAGLKAKLYQWGSLTQAQVDFAYSLHQQILREEEWAREELDQDREECPVGRVEIEGVVLTIKEQDNGIFGVVEKWLVRDNRGFKVWGTVPRAFEGTKGDTVRFRATVEQNEDDEYFGWASRPHLLKG